MLRKADRCIHRQTSAGISVRTITQSIVKLTLMYNVMAISIGSRKKILNGRATTASILFPIVTFFFSRGAHHLSSPVSFRIFWARFTSKMGLLVVLGDEDSYNERKDVHESLRKREQNQDSARASKES